MHQKGKLLISQRVGHIEAPRSPNGFIHALTFPIKEERIILQIFTAQPNKR